MRRPRGRGLNADTKCENAIVFCDDAAPLKSRYSGRGPTTAHICRERGTFSARTAPLRTIMQRHYRREQPE